YEVRKPVTGRELTEYGTVVEEPQNQSGNWQNTVAQSATAQSATAQSATMQSAAAQSATAQNTAAQGFAAQSAVMQGVGAAAATGPAPAAAMAAGPWQTVPQSVPVWENAGQGSQSRTGKAGKEPLSGGMIALIVILCIICFPAAAGLLGGALGIAAGILGGLLGLAVAWFAMIFVFGIAALVCILAGVFVSVVGVAGMGVRPLAGLGLVGGGLMAVGIGIFFLMLTVAMAGVATPAIFRGIGWLFNRIRKKV
ncbi:MAG: hypothetical protein K2L18_06070, partial [Acetatifactor sp.]|nr:hypothetical protein [Acetatifactor sp.]